MSRRPNLIAALLVILCATLLGGSWLRSAHAAAPTEDEKARARAYYIEGEELFKKELYAAAIENFKKANDIIPHPVNLYNIARAHEKLGDAENCVKGYQEYLEAYKRKNNGKDPSDIIDVRASIAKCQLLQRPEVTVESDPPGASIYIDDKTKLVGQTPSTLKLDPGKSNGGVFLGLSGVVIKSHGGTDAAGFAQAIIQGLTMVRNGLLAKIGEDLAVFHPAETHPAVTATAGAA